MTDGFDVKDAATSRDDMCRTMRYGLMRIGVADPNVGPYSEWYVLFTAVGREVAVIGAQAVLANDDLLPDTAGSTGLGRWGSMLDVEQQGAGGSIGAIVLESSASSPVVKGAFLTDKKGQRYQVTIGRTYANGALIPIEAVDAGATTNLEEGDVLQWANAPPYSASTAVVAPGGLINGIDAEDLEVVRERVFGVLREPPGAGNEEQVCEDAEDSAPQVQKAFCYSAALGPATTRVAVCAAPTPTNKARTVDATLVSGTCEPYVRGKMAGHSWTGVTSVTSVGVDVAFAISLPEAPTALPPGPGGGWVNGKVWPRPDGATTWRCVVTQITSALVFVVDAQTMPSADLSEIAWISPIDWSVYTATVTAVSGALGAISITVDTPFVGLAVGDMIFPAFEGIEAVRDAALAQFAVMGPGEISADPVVLTDAARYPPPANGWPMSLGAHLLHRLTGDVDTIAAAQFLYRSDGVQTLTGSAGEINPQPPTDPRLPPGQYVPRRLAFYRVP